MTEILKYRISDYTQKELEYFSKFIQGNPKVKKNETAVAHYFTLKYIAEKLNSDIDKIEFKFNDFGKPYVENAPNFSITHSGDYVFIAFSCKEIGIDAEIIRTVRHGLLKKITTDDEYEKIDKSNIDLQTLKIWTIKEAYFKLIGSGIKDINSVSTEYILSNFNVSTDITENYILTTIKKGR